MGFDWYWSVIGGANFVQHDLYVHDSSDESDFVLNNASCNECYIYSMQADE